VTAIKTTGILTGMHIEMEGLGEHQRCTGVCVMSYLSWSPQWCSKSQMHRSDTLAYSMYSMVLLLSMYGQDVTYGVFLALTRMLPSAPDVSVFLGTWQTLHRSE
jgi:hypothetical protein